MSGAADDAMVTNPVINTPYDPPQQHFELDVATGSPNGTLVPGRRLSESFIPMPVAKKRKAGQVALDFDVTGERREPNTLINDIRREVDLWRARNYPGATAISRKLMLYWADPDRENRVLYCQREAAETAIFLAEAAGRNGIADYRARLEPLNAEHNSDLPRVALKMATGSGKTVVMAMLIAWQTLNKVHSPHDARYAKRFLVVAPGITIRDRLRVLLPNDPENYYRLRELVPPDLWNGLREAHVLITNYHQFLKRDRKEIQGVASNTRKILTHGKARDPLQETDDEMVARVLRDFIGRAKGEIVVLNDEAHHCYQNKPLADDDAGHDREADERNRDARVWFRGLQAVKRKVGVKTIYDLSATPFYLSGSGHQEGYIFPWVVSDFSLMDAIESGIVKVPRLPIDDDAAGTDSLVYRNLWSQVGAALPKSQSRKVITAMGDWLIPAALDGALRSLYSSYAKAYENWEANLKHGGYETPPVFIVVCPNTLVSKLVFEWISGRDVEQADGSSRPVEGNLPLLSNVVDGKWSMRPQSVLIDSAQLESGEAMKDDFKRAAAHEIEIFKGELRQRNSSVDVDNLSDEDLLREVMNTVGKPGRLGEGVRCVVSVSMLTEGWDANTVTHILGVRAFNSRLLCEQVVGRALRRRNYTPNADGRFEPEYAEVYGVPFDFIPSDAVPRKNPPRSITELVRALPERSALRISFPRLVGYRLELIDEPLFPAFDPADHLSLAANEVATWVELVGQAGETAHVTTDDVRAARPQKVAYRLAEDLMRRMFLSAQGNQKHWYFPQVVDIAKQWLKECLHLPEGSPVGLLMLAQYRQRAVDRIEGTIRKQVGNQREVLQPRFDFEAEGSTDAVHFTTRKVVISAEKSHVNYVVLDGPKGNTWEEALSYYCEQDWRVASYAKNDHLGFQIPYLVDGVARTFLPDFVVRLTRQGADEPERTLIVEVSGGIKDQTVREIKAETARNSWCVAVNNHGGFGRWGFVEVGEIAKLQRIMNEAIDDLYADGVTTGGVGL
jgi:type III restriction enzyme